MGGGLVLLYNKFRKHCINEEEKESFGRTEALNWVVPFNLQVAKAKSLGTDCVQCSFDT